MFESDYYVIDAVKFFDDDDGHERREAITGMKYVQLLNKLSIIKHKVRSIIHSKRIINMHFTTFEVTGMTRGGRRLKTMRFSSFKAASMINLYSGSVWGVTEDGKRKLLRRVYN